MIHQRLRGACSDGFSVLSGEAFLRWFPAPALLSGAVSGADVHTHVHRCPQSLSLPQPQVGAHLQVGASPCSHAPVCWPLCWFPRGRVGVGSRVLAQGRWWKWRLGVPGTWMAGPSGCGHHLSRTQPRPLMGPPFTPGLGLL